VRPIELLRQGAGDDGAGGVDEAFEFLEVLIDLMPRVGSLERRSDENCAVDGRVKVYWGSDNRQARGGGSVR
jgi:hypothetical protein